MRTRISHTRGMFWRPGRRRRRGGQVWEAFGAAALYHLVEDQADDAVAQGHHRAQEVQQAQSLRRIVVLAHQRQQKALHLDMQRHIFSSQGAQAW